MLTWVCENLATIIISTIIIAIVAAVIIGMIRNKKKGRYSCGCGCANCAMSTSCQAVKRHISKK